MEDPPTNTPASPPIFLQIKFEGIEAVVPVSFAKNLSVIPQLLGPQNCLGMPQNHSQKAQI